MTSVEYNDKSDSVNVFVKIYYDDFLLDYKLFNDDFNVNEHTDADEFSSSLLERYVDDRLLIVADNEPLHGTVESLIVEDNELKATLVYKILAAPEIFSIENRFLLDLYDDQTNMTIVRLNDFEEGIKFTSDITKKTFTLP